MTKCAMRGGASEDAPDVTGRLLSATRRRPVTDRRQAPGPRDTRRVCRHTAQGREKTLPGMRGGLNRYEPRRTRQTGGGSGRQLPPTNVALSQCRRPSVVSEGVDDRGLVDDSVGDVGSASEGVDDRGLVDDSVGDVGSASEGADD